MAALIATVIEVLDLAGRRRTGCANACLFLMPFSVNVKLLL
jgi:hypothetical protein